MRLRVQFRLLLALLLATLAPSAFAQVISATTYQFTAGTATLEDMSSGTVQLVGQTLDDTASPLTQIGFEFLHNGVRQTLFSVNANGLMRLGPTLVTTSFDNTTFNSTTNAPKIAPYFEDLCTGNNGKVHSKVIGTAPNRKLVVEWLNMQVSRGAGCLGLGNGTFQAWLFETSGVIQFVYGSMQVPAAADLGYSIGTQAGAATNFAAITAAAPGTVSYTVASNAQATAIVAGTSFTLAPIPPAAPTALNFTAITPVSYTVNWTDNAGGELGYLVFRSDDGGTTFVQQAQLAANAVSFPATNLSAATSYTWRIQALGEGTTSASLQGSQATAAAGTVNSVANGLWSNPATWSTNAVPVATDNVTIAAGNTVTIDTAALAFNVSVAGTLEFDAAAAQSLASGGSVTVQPGGTFRSATTGTITAHVLSVGGSLTNNGTLDFSTNADTAGAGITFGVGANGTFGGTGATTDIRAISVNKGTLAATIELAPTNFTVLGATTDVAGWLSLTSGTFKLSGTFAGTNRVFTSPTYTIPVNCGFWLNNPNYSIVGQAGGTTTVNNGLLRITQGTYNIGVTGADGMGGGVGAQFIIEGGTLSSAGRISPAAAVLWTQSGGTINVATVGNTVSNVGSFELLSTTTTFTMSGGTINVIQPSTGATKVDFTVRSAFFTITGGQVVIGAAPAPAGSSYNNNGGIIPSFTVNANMTFNMNNAALFMRGTTVVNTGTIAAIGANARFDFAGTAPMTYGGGGVFGTATVPFAGVGMSSNSPSRITLSSPIFVNRVNLFTGGFNNAGLITLGSGAASTTVVQCGAAGVTLAGGTFDVSPVHNQGTGGQIVLYANEGLPRTTGVEINPTRNLFSLSIDNPNGVTVAGGDLTLTQPAAAAALTLTNGRLITGANTVAIAGATATVVRTNGYVDGNLRKTYAAAGNKTFEVGTANGFTPVIANPTAGAPTAVAIRAVQGPLPGIAPVGTALRRHWVVSSTTTPTVDLTFAYLDPADIPGTATEANFVVYLSNGATLTNIGGTVTVATNTAAITGQATLGTYTLAEPGATINNAPTLTAGGITRREGDAVLNSIVANGNDVEDAENTLVVTANGGASATVNGVTVNTIVMDVAGVVTANVVAACGATNAGFTLRVTDSGGQFAESPLNVQVTPNLVPVLSYNAASTTIGASSSVNPATGPSDTGTISTIVVQSTSTYTGGATVNAAGVVSLTSAAPAGTHTITIRATDNCNAITDAPFQLTVTGTTTDLGITKTSNLSQAGSGLIQYTVTATNFGPLPVTGATVADTIPAIVTGATWTCTATGGASCTSPGSGNINQLVNLPVSGTVTYAISGNIPTDPPPGFIVNTATITSSAGVPDSNSANNSATVNDAVVLFRNGFEDGPGNRPALMLAMPPNGGQLALPLDPDAVAEASVTVAARDVALFRSGDELVLVSARRIGGEVQLRVLQRDVVGGWHAGPWASVVPGQSAILLWSRDAGGGLHTGVQLQ